MIISLALAMSYQILQQARQAATVAWEARRADTLLRFLLETSPRSLDVRTGATDGFSWRVQTDSTGAETPIQICRRSAMLHAAGSGRTYQAATLETCPVVS